MSDPVATPRVTATLDLFRITAADLARRLRDGAVTMSKRVEAVDVGGARNAKRLADELDDLAGVLRDGLPSDTEARALRRAQVAARLLDIQREGEELLAQIPRMPPRSP